MNIPSCETGEIRGLLEVAVPGPDGANEHPNRVYDR